MSFKHWLKIVIMEGEEINPESQLWSWIIEDGGENELDRIE